MKLKSGFFLMIFSSVTFASADLEVYLGAWTYHFDRDGDYNQTNDLIGFEYKKWMVYHFENSFNDESVFIGRRFAWQADIIPKVDIEYGVKLGLVSGYDENLNAPELFGEHVCGSFFAAFGTEGKWIDVNVVAFKHDGFMSAGFRFSF